MGKLIFQINVSLDGYADHTAFEATADDEMHEFYTGLLDETEVALFGRVTYQLMESYWPHAHEDPKATSSMLRFADKFNSVAKIVFSRTLQQANWNNTKLVRADVANEVLKLKKHSRRDISVGGISLSRELMRLGLVDEYWIVLHPVLAGTGRRLFEGQNDRVNLKLLESRSLRSGVVALHYSDKRD
jgi:dihydrofolate reductase